MFGMLQSRAAAPPAPESDGVEAHYSCRICFEDAKPSELISPCKCKGTLKYVHQACLHRWQANVQRLGGKRDERATVCGVCRSRYTSLPPKSALHVWRKVWAAARGLVGAVLISLLALCLSGPPVLHLALLVLLLLGTRSQSLLAVLLLVVGGVVASLYARGLRLVVRGDGDGDFRFGLALIRHGAPIEGLQAGSLLVAHGSSLQGTLFAQAVVLITEKSARGARGVMLTQPMETVDSQLWSQQPLSEGMASQLAHSAPIRHYLGGPVGLPSRTGPASHTVVLHHMAAVPGASTLIAASRTAAGAAAAVQSQQEQEQEQPSAAAAAAAAAAQDQQAQQQQPARRLPTWQKMLKACSSTGRRQQQQPLVQPTPSAPSRSSNSSSSATVVASPSFDSLALYQGGSMDVLLQVALQANSAVAATAAAAAAAAAAPPASPTAAPGQGSFASKLRWPLHHRAAGNRQHSRNTNNQQQQQQQAASSNRAPGDSQQQQQQLSQLELAALAASVRMYHGVCVWGAGQLEGEIRAGSWGVAAAELRDIITTPPQLLWEQLLGSNRARWF